MPDQLGALALDERTWDDAIERAVRGVGVRPVFQPIVDLARGTVVGYEALARFEGGPDAPPNVWFAAAARRAAVESLEAAVLRAALQTRSQLPTNTFLTVNVEPESLHSTDVLNVLRSNAPLDGIVVEITEHRELGDPVLVRQALERLRRLGAMIAVDDAGAGYSGLQQILTLRPHILKIDRSLVEGVDRDEAKAALLEMLGVFASRIDAWVLAEGIETAEEARRIISLQVPLAQGWFFGRPAAPWAGIPPTAQALLLDLQGPRRTGGLRRVLQVVPTVELEETDTHAAAFGDAGIDHVVVLDRERPVGLLTPVSAVRGELLRPLIANVNSTPADVAHRITTRHESDLVLPVVVTDDAGRYLGIVTVVRLLGELAR